MSKVLNDPTALEDSIQRMCKVEAPDSHLDLNHGVRSPADLHRILLDKPVRIDREGLAQAAMQAFSSDPRNQ